MKFGLFCHIFAIFLPFFSILINFLRNDPADYYNLNHAYVRK